MSIIRRVVAACALATPFFLPTSAPAQCLLANASFEVGGTGGAVFGGWNQFGIVGQSTTGVDHGQRAARLQGPNLGSWDASAFWQPLDSTPGEQWEVTARVRVDGAAPLTAGSIAMVNVEWRDASDLLISYETHTAADAASPTDTWIDFSVTSGPAPAGTVHARLLLGVLQSPGSSTPVIHYDTATFYSTNSPTMAEQQWVDFPGGRVLDFAGRSWRVKGDGFYGPGPNHFADDADHVWVDGNGKLHLTIRNEGGVWYSTEVVLEEPLGYGDYVFTTEGRLDLLDIHAVLGLFVWQYGPCWDASQLWWNPYNEIDIEFSRWGNPATDICAFTAQPYDWPGNQSTWDGTFSPGELTSHAFRWLPDRVEWRSWRGDAFAESPGTLIHAWTYTGPHVPRPEQPRVHLNFWHVFNPPTSDQEAVLHDFRFVPEGAVSVGPLSLPPDAAGRLRAARPNPFTDATRIEFVLERDADVDVSIFDVGGRLVRTLVDGPRPAGSQWTTWDGRDAQGTPLGSGVYFYRLRAGDSVETRKLTRVR